MRLERNELHRISKHQSNRKYNKISVMHESKNRNQSIRDSLGEGTAPSAPVGVSTFQLRQKENYRRLSLPFMAQLGIETSST